MPIIPINGINWVFNGVYSGHDPRKWSRTLKSIAVPLSELSISRSNTLDATPLSDTEHLPGTPLIYVSPPSLRFLSDVFFLSTHLSPTHLMQCMLFIDELNRKANRDKTCHIKQISQFHVVLVWKNINIDYYRKKLIRTSSSAEKLLHKCIEQRQLENTFPHIPTRNCMFPALSRQKQDCLSFRKRISLIASIFFPQLGTSPPKSRIDMPGMSDNPSSHSTWFLANAIFFPTKFPHEP